LQPRCTVLGLLAACGLLLCGCGTPKKTAATSSKPATANGCTPAKLPLHTKGVLTVATDSPAYPPYFENNKPANGKGFESAVAYAIAGKLGFSRNQVKWTVEPFDSSYAPGPKNFDFDVNEISITKPRSQAVDFSAPYYTNPQAIIVAAGSSYAHATTLVALEGAKFGVQIGSTSLDALDSVVRPSQKPQVFNDSHDVVSAFKIHRVNAIVVDLATAFELTATDLPHTVIAGQFNAPGGDTWGALLTKGSGLSPCVDKAVSSLRADGTLAVLSKRWIASAANVPVLR
jgi:polar amino acid transport system substrate-binding protein